MERKVAVLTMSSKNSGNCVAGIDIETGEWVRLVSDDAQTHGALSNEDVEYENGKHCKPLDVVKVAVLCDAPLAYQPENLLIDSNKYMSKVREITIDELLRIHPVERHMYLLGNQYPYITDAKVGTVGHSLVLVEVNNLTLIHPTPTSTKATFLYRGTLYEKISVTDRDYYNTPNLWYTNKAVLVISIPDAPFPENRYYKFVAKIFPIE